MYFLDELAKYDKEVYDATCLELQRQRDNIELIASENIVSKAVLLAAGTILTNKYAEGYPASAITAAVSTSTSSRISRATAPRSSSAPSMPTSSPIRGASANLAVFFALRRPRHRGGL